MNLKVTESLKESLAELYYREGCDQNGWAFVPTGKIRIDENVIEFEIGVWRIRIKVPAQFASEITSTTAFDYLACQIGRKEKYDSPIVANPLALCWVKVGRPLSQAHIDALEKVRLPLAIFSIRNILAPPAQIEVKWDVRPGKEWLDELDDKRDQAESDDDYF